MVSASGFTPGGSSVSAGLRAGRFSQTDVGLLWKGFQKRTDRLRRVSCTKRNEAVPLHMGASSRTTIKLLRRTNGVIAKLFVFTLTMLRS